MSIASDELRDMLPTWAVAVLLPLPAATFWQDGSGRSFAYIYLFLGCALVVAERFSCPGEAAEGPHLWRSKMAALAVAAAGAVGVFTAFGWSMGGRAGFEVPLLAALAVLPALGCVPFLTIRTGKPYAAVLFALLLMGAIKVVGCLVVRAVYGADALAQGYMTLPWEEPNLLVWLCLAGAILASVALHLLGRRAFLAEARGPAAVTAPSAS